MGGLKRLHAMCQASALGLLRIRLYCSQLMKLIADNENS
jgi:hypothetical protein